MGKSIRSKIKKRLRTAKRQRVDAMIVKPREQEHFDALQKVIEGRSVTLARAPNAFKYPDAAGAVFPQHEVMKPIDFRAQNLPMAGYVFRGNRRKYEGEQAEKMKDLAVKSHPKMEVLAGGGAVLAKTGARISITEAEVEATKAQDPQAAAIAEAGPSRAASAVAAAVAEDDLEMRDAEQVPIPESDDEQVEASAASSVPLPANEADTSRRPLVKDTRRDQRNRPRANAVKKKGKAKTVAIGDVKASAASESQASKAAASTAPAAASVPAAAEAASSPPAAAAIQGASPNKKKTKSKKASNAPAAGEAQQMEAD